MNASMAAGLIAISFCLPLGVRADAPPGFNYQAMVRDAKGIPIKNGGIGIRFRILKDSANGPVVYGESQTTTTNGYGMVSAVVGRGISTHPGADLKSVSWETGVYFLGVGIDPKGGSNYKSVGVAQLMSVPYALFAGKGNPGPQGAAGPRGDSGLGIRSSAILDGRLVLEYSDGRKDTLGRVVGADADTNPPNEISDADGDTKIRTEALPDEDKIRIDIGGKEILRLISAGFMGVGLKGADPGEMLHIGDGHILLEGGGQVALKIKRDTVIHDGPSGTSANPIFQIGRIIRAGDGDPELRFLYSDDQTSERTVFELDRKGIVASVKQEIGSHFEGFLDQKPDPCFRLNSYPKMQLEMGSCTEPVDVAVRREAENTLSILTGTGGGIERVSINEKESAFSGYVKLASASGAPPSNDCMDATHRGRMKVDAGAGKLWICVDSGWLSK